MPHEFNQSLIFFSWNCSDPLRKNIRDAKDMFPTHKTQAAAETFRRSL